MRASVNWFDILFAVRVRSRNFLTLPGNPAPMGERWIKHRLTWMVQGDLDPKGVRGQQHAAKGVMTPECHGSDARRARSRTDRTTLSQRQPTVSREITRETASKPVAPGRAGSSDTRPPGNGAASSPRRQTPNEGANRRTAILNVNRVRTVTRRSPTSGNAQGDRVSIVVKRSA